MVGLPVRFQYMNSVHQSVNQGKNNQARILVSATTWTNFLAPFADATLKTSRGYYVFYAADKEGIRVTSVKLARPEGDVYVYLIAVEWGRDEPVYKAKRGAHIAVDIVEARAMTQNMVVVNADEMSKAIAAAGRVALYAIYFDTNKAEVKPSPSRNWPRSPS